MEVRELWPELEWIKDDKLRESTRKTWELAFSRSVLKAEDLLEIPFTLLCEGEVATFMEHKRCVVHISRKSGEEMNRFFEDKLPVDMDILISGAILCDVGKLLEYDYGDDGNLTKGEYGKYLRHPFSGVSIAEECGVGKEVLHIIAAHAGEGDKVKRSTEAYIVHHADFMTYLPFKERLK